MAKNVLLGILTAVIGGAMIGALGALILGLASGLLGLMSWGFLPEEGVLANAIHGGMRGGIAGSALGTAWLLAYAGIVTLRGIRDARLPAAA